jgi:hypothetical protein
MVKGPYEDLAIKLLAVVSESIGACFRPWLTRRDASANALADAEKMRIERLAQEELRQAVKDVRAGKKTIGGDLRLLAAPDTQSGENTRALQQVKLEYIKALESSGISAQRLIEVERQINLDQIAALAVQEALADEDGVADPRPIEPDWFTQWRNRAQDVSNEDMQRLWARVLKGEAKKASSFSIHTMDFLSRMSREDADLIAKLGSFVLDGNYIYSRSKVISTCIIFDKLMYLDELALLSGIQLTGVLSTTLRFSEISPGNYVLMIRCCEKAICCLPKPPYSKTIPLPVAALSSVARELLTLAECNANIDYLHEIGREILPHCESISIAEVDSSEGDNYSIKLPQFQ